MAQLISSRPSCRWRKGGRFFLAFSWVAGMLCGFFSFGLAGWPIVSMMHGVPYTAVSIVWFFIVILLPILLSALAVFLSSNICLLAVCFIKAFLFAYVSLGIYLAFGDAGWLMRRLILFGQCVTIPVLYWFWMRRLSEPRSGGILETVMVIGVIILLGSTHVRFISPILAGLIDF